MTGPWESWWFVTQSWLFGKLFPIGLAESWGNFCLLKLLSPFFVSKSMKGFGLCLSCNNLYQHLIQVTWTVYIESENLMQSCSIILSRQTNQIIKCKSGANLTPEAAAVSCRQFWGHYSDASSDRRGRLPAILCVTVHPWPNSCHSSPNILDSCKLWKITK